MQAREGRLLALLLGLTLLLTPVAGAAGVGTGPTTAAAQSNSPPSLLDAVELSTNGEDVVGSNSNTGSVIEVAFDQPVRRANANATLNRSAITVRVNGEVVTDRYVLDDDGSRAATNPGQVVLSSSEELTPYDTVRVEFAPLTSPGTDAVTNRIGTGVTVTDGVVSETVADDDEDTAEIGIFAGAPLAVVADDGEGDLNNPVRVERSGYGFVTDASTGQNSQVYTFDTKERNESARYLFDMTADPGDATDDNVPSVRYYSLDIETEIEPTRLAPGGTVEVTVSAGEAGRRFNVVLNGPDDFKRTKQVELDTQPEGGTTVEFGPLTRTGSYKANAKDRLTDKNQKSGSAEVVEGSASLDADLLTEQRGDVVEIPISLSSTDTATVRLGSDDRGYEATLEVNDGDDDGTVTVEWNTYLADGPADGTGEGFAAGDDDDSVSVRSVDSDVAGGDAAEPDVVAAAGYGVAVSAEGDLDTPAGAGVVDLRPRRTTSIGSYRAPARLGGDFDETAAIREALASGNLTEGSTVARGDLLVLRIDASGLEGALGSEDDVTDAYADRADQVSVTLSEVDPPANRQPVAVRLTPESTRIVADAANDTYFVVLDTATARTVVDTGPPGERFQSAPTDPDEATDPLAADTTLRANVTVFGTDGGLADEQETVGSRVEVIEAEYGIDDGYEVPSGRFGVVTSTTLAPGSEVTVRMRGVDTASGAYLKTDDVRVPANGTVRARLGSAGVSVGDEVEITLDSPAVETTVDGSVVDAAASTATPTPTPSPTPNATPANGTATPSPTPTPTNGTATPSPTPTPTSTGTGTPASTALSSTTTPTDGGSLLGGISIGPNGGIALIGIGAVLVAGYALAKD